jgi:hypothetical protein
MTSMTFVLSRMLTLPGTTPAALARLVLVVVELFVGRAESGGERVNVPGTTAPTFSSGVATALAEKASPRESKCLKFKKSN